eukprot:TRINITY_DN2404_c0_g1_i1.p1 TRINITY_DN2404_c0_g1~~TRINITY_DN2404_c0_g1_i1.p1  ORF type:complete len:186 (-),score=22.08 TRINITY_DN2404_c0_g1_i1:79-636(-)
MEEFKVIVFGSIAVGKSSLVLQFLTNIFVDEYDPTIEDSHRKRFVIDNEDCFLEIWDTTNLENLNALREQQIQSSDGFIFVYDITNRETFEDVENYRTNVLRHRGVGNVNNIILVGNKCDLGSYRKVSTEEGQRLADSFGATFFETSAKDRINVAEAFVHLVRLIRMDFIKRKNQERRKHSCTLQ